MKILASPLVAGTSVVGCTGYIVYEKMLGTDFDQALTNIKGEQNILRGQLLSSQRRQEEIIKEAAEWDALNEHLSSEFAIYDRAQKASVENAQKQIQQNAQIVKQWNDDVSKFVWYFNENGEIPSGNAQDVASFVVLFKCQIAKRAAGIVGDTLKPGQTLPKVCNNAGSLSNKRTGNTAEGATGHGRAGVPGTGGVPGVGGIPGAAG